MCLHLIQKWENMVKNCIQQLHFGNAPGFGLFPQKIRRLHSQFPKYIYLSKSAHTKVNHGVMIICQTHFFIICHPFAFCYENVKFFAIEWDHKCWSFSNGPTSRYISVTTHDLYELRVHSILVKMIYQYCIYWKISSYPIMGAHQKQAHMELVLCISWKIGAYSIS